MAALSRIRFQHPEPDRDGHRGHGDGRRRIVFEHVARVRRGVPALRHDARRHLPSDGRVVTAPPAMWAEALDAMMGESRGERRRPVRGSAAISGSGQQHGSVYLAAEAPRPLLADSIRRDRWSSSSTALFSRPVSPVWLDCSTTRGVRRPDDARSAATRALARLTGSRAYERFTARADPEVRDTRSRRPTRARDRIHLVSSFMASLLCRPRTRRSSPATRPA